MSWIYGFTPEIVERGDLLPITKTHNSNIFLPTLVNNAQDLMCLKNKPNFKYKLHPIQEHSDRNQRESEQSDFVIPKKSKVEIRL